MALGMLLQYKAGKECWEPGRMRKEGEDLG